jgi:hypothetical protein
MHAGDGSDRRSPPPPESPWWLPSLARPKAASPVSGTSSSRTQQAAGALVGDPSELYRPERLAGARSPQPDHAANKVSSFELLLLSIHINLARLGMQCHTNTLTSYSHAIRRLIPMLTTSLAPAGLSCCQASKPAQQQQQPAATFTPSRQLAWARTAPVLPKALQGCCWTATSSSSSNWLLMAWGPVGQPWQHCRWAQSGMPVELHVTSTRAI